MAQVIGCFKFERTQAASHPITSGSRVRAQKNPMLRKMSETPEKPAYPSHMAKAPAGLDLFEHYCLHEGAISIRQLS